MAPPPTDGPPPPAAQEEKEQLQEPPDVEGLAHYVALGLDDTLIAALRRAGADPAARLEAVPLAAVRASWRRAARRLHPDKQQQQASSSAAALFARARLAYDVLGDARRRKAYDKMGADAGLAAARASAGGGGGGRAATSADRAASGSWARGAAGAVPVTAWYGDEDGDDALAAAAAGVAEEEEQQQRRRQAEEAAISLDALLLSTSCSSNSSSPAAPILDPSRQLAVLCELCPRPAAGRRCWTCGAWLCAFCSRRPHYALQGAPLGGRGRRRRPPGLVPPHWPLVDAPGSVAEALGKQEWERKRLEDGRRAVAAAEAASGRGTELERRALAEFLADEEGGKEEEKEQRQRRQRYYRWSVAKSGLEARVAVFLPMGCIGAAEGEARVEVEGGGGGSSSSGSPLLLSVFTAGSNRSVIDRRRLALPCGEGGAAAAVDVRVAAGGRAVVVRLALSAPVPPSCRLFEGDEPGARRRWSGGGSGDSTRPLYVVTDEDEEEGGGGGGRGGSSGGGSGSVRVSFPSLLPWWIEPREDVQVGFEATGLRVRVPGINLDVRRTYCAEAAAALADEARCAWWVEEEEHGEGGATAVRQPRTLSILVALRPPTEEERTYKRGVRQDHRVAPSPRLQSPLGPWLPSVQRSPPPSQGKAFFVEDEDEFGLDALLDQAEREEEETEV
jgi:hypothetical protein